MKREKKRRLERADWRVSDTAEFLGLNTQEQRFIELKLALAAGIRQLRERRGLTQVALARQLLLIRLFQQTPICRGQRSIARSRSRMPPPRIA